MQSTAIFLNTKIFFPLNRKDENEQLLLSLVFFHEKQDAINKSHRLDQFLMEILNISCGWIWYNTQISWWAWRFLGHWSQSQPSNREPLIIQSSDMLLYFLSFTCRFPFHFTPLKKGSLYDTTPLCFLYLHETGKFKLKEEAKKWPLMCHTDPSWHDTGKYKIRRLVTLFFSPKVMNSIIFLHTFCSLRSKRFRLVSG